MSKGAPSAAPPLHGLTGQGAAWAARSLTFATGAASPPGRSGLLEPACVAASAECASLPDLMGLALSSPLRAMGSAPSLAAPKARPCQHRAAGPRKANDAPGASQAVTHCRHTFAATHSGPERVATCTGHAFGCERVTAPRRDAPAVARRGTRRSRSARRAATPYSSSSSSPPPISSSTPSAAGMTSSCFTRKGYASLRVLG